MDYSFQRLIRKIRNSSNEEIWKYLYQNNEGVKLLTELEPTVFGKDGVRNDYWTCYDYGNEVKFVYFKKGVITQKKNTKKYRPEKDTSDNAEKQRFNASLSRSKSRVFELAMCNEFQYFCTFTQDKEKRDRFDITKFRKDFTMLIRNLNRNRENKIKYLLIPEQHQDGAWHMHGLLMGLSNNDLTEFKLTDNIPQKIKKQLKNGKKVFNWITYSRKFGYFTCSPIENKNACSRYITKYITKDLRATHHESGEHLYFASQGLKGREVIVKNSFDECPIIDGWDFENDYVKIKTVKLS